MHSGKSYLAVHRSWFDQDDPTTGPRCYQDDESFEHAILKCPARPCNQDLLLKDVSSVDPGTKLWLNNSLLQALSQYILVTITGFPPEMLPYSSPPEQHCPLPILNTR